MADGGMTNDAPMMQGGITDLALRDEFFLGGIVKGIKKGLKGVTRAVKKVAKSPIGKAALLAGVAGIPLVVVVVLVKVVYLVKQVVY